MQRNSELDVFSREPSIGMLLPEKCNWSQCDLDLWPFDLKI